MDKLEAVRLASIYLDRARDDEFHTSQAWQRAKVRLIEADKAYARALDALHEARSPGTDHDATPKPSMERTG